MVPKLGEAHQMTIISAAKDEMRCCFDSIFLDFRGLDFIRNNMQKYL